MFKTLFFILIVCVYVNAEIKKITDVVAKDLDGNDVSFKKFNGKCILVINTASGCGLTKPNMKYLNDLQKKHSDLVILAFPSNT